jgi:hypothetical protein
MRTTVTTNNQPRQLMYLNEFSETQQKQIRSDFNWMSPNELETSGGFFRYRSSVYHLNEFSGLLAAPHEALHGWDGYVGETWFAGVLIKLVDSDSVIVGRYCD